jgi:uncharacterized protein YoaH (UPF0181 family)
MEKCWKSGCTKEVAMKCSCTAEGVFSCHKHAPLHSGSSENSSQHMMTFISVKLSGEKQQKALTQIQELVQQLQAIEEAAIKNTALAMSIINEQLNKYLIKIRENQFDLRKILNKLLARKTINRSAIERIRENLVGFKSNNESDSKIIQSLSKLYSVDPVIRELKDEDCENAIFFDNYSGASLINLTTFKSSQFSCYPARVNYAIGTQIESNLYFISSGNDSSSKVQSDAYTVDTKTAFAIN